MQAPESTKTGVSATHHTLLLGTGQRPTADFAMLDERGALLAPLAHDYSEVELGVPLEQLDDPWLTLRSIAAQLPPGAVLTVTASHGRRAALGQSTIRNLLQISGIEPVHCDRTPETVRVRAKRIAVTNTPRTCTVVVPCRNERHNIEPLVRRLPAMGSHTELLFVDGSSSDGTPDRIQEVICAHPERDIKLLIQNGGHGKAGAVFQGFDAAAGDVLMILDADMTVAPEDLPRFYEAVAEGVADLANGTRFAYSMEAGAMAGLNRAGNQIFSRVMSWLLGTRVGDTLCGTKALSREHWRRIAAVRSVLGGHDRWGDFDLLQGAALCNLRIVDVPVRYYARTAGESKMRPFSHGLQLARSCIAGFIALKTPVRRRI